MAVYAGSVGGENAYVVQHCRALHFHGVEVEAALAVYGECEVGHLSCVLHIYMSQLVVVGVVFVDNFLIGHCCD